VVKRGDSDLFWRGREFGLDDADPPNDAEPRDRPIDVLVVDNDHASRTSFGLILRDAGYNADEAEDGFAALERLRSVPVGSVLLELDLPGLGGLQLLDTLDNPPPVILMTAGEYSTDVMIRRSKAYMFIQKPIPPAHLVAAVSRTLEASRQRRRDLIASTPWGFRLEG
jgi:DNA-binding response OmpR family regulator